jgi:type II secretory pathway component GspD/PulD (secretin)
MTQSRSAFRHWFAEGCAALVAGVCLFLLVTQVRADQGNDKPVTKILPLRYSTAAEVEKTLAAMFGDKAGPKGKIFLRADQRTNSLIVTAVPDDLFEIAKVVQMLDVPAEPQESRTEIYVYRLGHLEPGPSLEEALHLVMPPKGAGRFVIDRERRNLIVYGPPEAIQAVKTLLSRIDLPSGLPGPLELEVRVFWFVAANKDAEAPKLGNEFQEIEAELKTLGLQRPFLLGQAMARTEPGVKFEITGQVERRPFTVVGQVGEPGSIGKLNLQIMVGGPEASKAACILKTHTMVTPGRMVVVGTATTENTTSAFVVQVAGKLPPPPGKKAAFAIPEKPWKAVFEWLSDHSGLPVVANDIPTGTCSIVPMGDKPAKLADIIDLLNEVLIQKQFLLIRGERSIKLVPADERIDPALVPRVEEKDLSQRGRTELVSVVVSLHSLQADKVATSIKKMMGPFGSVITVPEANRLVLQDTAGNLRQVCKLIREIDAKDKVPAKKAAMVIPEKPWAE